MKLPRVQRLRGGRYKYHRVTGARLPDLPEDHPEFVAAWATEEAKGAPAPTTKTRGKPRSIAAACGAYLASEQHLALSTAYRAIIRHHLDAVSETYGAASMRDLRGRHIEADLAKLPPHASRKRLKAWRQLCTFARAAQLITQDPSAGIQAKRAPKSDGHLPWTKAEIEALRKHWPIDHPRRLAFELLFWTGCRISDAVKLNRGMITDGVLTFSQTKTGGPAHVPWSRALPPFADRQTFELLTACIEAQRPELLFLATRTGAPRSVKSMSNWISETARLAGIHKSAHGLRKSRLIDLAERGAPALALMSWGGHETLSEVQHYIDAAERKRAVTITEQEQNDVKRSGPACKTQN